VEAEDLCRLGEALFRQERFAESLTAFRQVVERETGNADAWCNLGAVHYKLQQLAEAEAAYQQCLALNPGHIDALVNYGLLLANREQCERASELLREALRIRPESLAARENLALALFLQGSLAFAETEVRHLLSFDPQSASAWRLLGAVLEGQGRATDAIAAFQRSLEIAPDADTHSSLLLAMQYADEVSADGLLNAHKEWNAAHAVEVAAEIPKIFAPGTFNQALRIGFVSASFWTHPIGFLGMQALEGLKAAGCTVVCYSDTPRQDEFTARFRQAASIWRETRGLSAPELAQQIRDDRIDILVDLMGHTGDRLLVFTRKPAPVQMTWLGYVGTTGVTAINFLLADRYHVAEGEESNYVETVLRMPHGYACYSPPAGAPSPARLPGLASGQVTFGSFNNPAKYSAGTLDCWAEVLRRVSRSRLLLKYKGLDDAMMQSRLRQEFSRRGVDPERILLEGKSPHTELLAQYCRVDLALDTQPYSGGLTTCEALWMGVPVITYPGNTFAGRHSTSHLMNAGYSQFVANDREHFASLAVEWAIRLDELAIIRSQMRERVRQSVLCDGPRFARDFFDLLTRAWQSRRS
jgi:protein O-GlcNAc transferase